MSPDETPYAARRIIVATDLSEPANAALRVAIEVGRRSCTELSVMHVVPPPVPSGADFGYVIPALDEESRGRFTAQLRGFAAPSILEGIETHVTLREGVPAEEIVGEARAMGADLVAVGRRGRRALDRLLLGSVAESVARHAPCPVLIVPEVVNPVRPIRRVLCAVDLHASSSHTLAHAIGLGNGLDVDVSVLHVVADAALSTARYPFDVSDHSRPRVDDAQRALEVLVRGTPGAAARLERRIAWGEPQARILRASASGEADLLVMGMHPGGRSKLGPTVRDVVHEAGCPVLLVPALATRHHVTAPAISAVQVWK